MTAKTGPVQVETAGRLGPKRRIGGWPNLVEVADLALRHFNEICDPRYHYVPYVGASVGWRTPAFKHHRWDWIEVLPYPIIARIVARRLTGNRIGDEIERRQRQLLLSSFHNLDGFAYPHYAQGWSEDTQLCLWEQGRVMYALLAWFEDSGDERLLHYVRGIVRGLMSISQRDGRYRRIDAPYDHNGAFGRLSPISMVECLAKYHALTGDSDALDLGEGIVRTLLEPSTQFTDDRDRLSGFLRGCAAAIASITRFAAYTQDERLLDRAERLFRSAHGLIADCGATPEEEPCCTNMEMTTAGLALTACGRGDWWDMIDRYFRNQVAECQFRDPAAVNVGYVPGEPQPWDDTRDIVNRSIGGFFWASPYEYLCWRIRLMLCCSSHAIWTLGKIVQHAVTERDGGIAVNLHYTLETPLASITSHEPFTGKLDVVPARSGPVTIRKPGYAPRVDALVDGAPAHVTEKGNAVTLEHVRAGSRITLTYPLPEKTTEQIVRLPQQEGGGTGEYCGAKADPVVGHRIAATWRGNTVLAIDYANSRSLVPVDGSTEDRAPQPKHRLYANRMARYDAGIGADDEAAFFLTDRFTW